MKPRTIRLILSIVRGRDADRLRALAATIKGRTSRLRG